MNFEALTGIQLDHEIRSVDSTVRFTSTRRAAAINEGCAEFADLTECLSRVSTVTCSCNTATYNLNSSAVMSTDFVRIAARGIEYHLLSSGSSPTLQQICGDDFPRRDVEWLNKYEPGWRQSTTPTMPQSYSVEMDGGSYLLRLHPPPDIGSSETGKVILPYVARPVPMTSTGDIPFTVGGVVRNDLTPFHKASVHYAAHQLEKLRGDDEASDRQYTKFLSYVERYTGKVRTKGANFVTLAKNYLKAAHGPRMGSWADGKDPYRDA